MVRGQFSPASDDIEVVSWWWLGVPTTWLPPLHHLHHTASENITSYTPTPSNSDGLTGELFVAIFSEEKEKMIYCSNCLAGISREYFIVWAASTPEHCTAGQNRFGKNTAELNSDDCGKTCSTLWRPICQS